MAKQTINIGASPNDGTGTPLRTAFDYTNQNFTELYTATGPSGNNIVVPGSATITGDLTVDTSTLKVDSANNRVGIGTASPAAGYALDVRGLLAAGNSAGTIVGGISFSSRPEIGAISNHNLGLIANNTTMHLITPAGVFDWYDGAGGTRMTLNATGLGVGVSPTYNIDVLGATLPTLAVRATSAGASNARLYLECAGTNGGNLTYNRSLQALQLGANGSTSAQVTLDSLGNVGIGVTPSAGKGCLQLSSGINFPATQVASTDPNTLDDYEEGLWTPVVADAATGGNVGTYVNNGSTYTKIGNQVSIQTYISSINTTGLTGTNAIIIRGIPFAAFRGGQGSFYTYRVGRNASTVSSSAFLAGGTSHIAFNLFGTNSSTTDLRILVSDITSGTSEIILSVTYFV